MSFFLLGQGRDSLDLRLISDQVFATKQDAMAELSSVTADPDFPHWDADVMVMDLEAGTPVLLVKPKVADVPVETPPSPETTVDAVIPPEDRVEPAQDEVGQDVVEEAEPEVQAPSDEHETAGVWESPEPETSIADDLVTFEEIPGEPDDSLAQAIKRATGALEDEGITAPESIGPAQVDDEATESDQIDISSDAATGEHSAAAWPWAVVAQDPSVEPELEAELSGESEVEADPVDAMGSEPEPVVAPYVPDPFEEPAIDVGSAGMVSLPTEGDESDANGPVILGEYGAAGIAGDLVLDEAPAAPMSESAAADVKSDDPEMDLENSTCEECVYAETCPNKGELDPKSCGSFQWK